MSARLDGAAFVRELQTLSAGIRNNAGQALRAAVRASEDDAKSTTLFKDGATARLRQNIVGTVEGLTGELKASTAYAQWVESGTQPHVIEAKSGGLLRFVVAGRVIFARRVRHPGTAPRPFMQHAADVGDKTLDYGIEYFTDYAISKFNQSG